MSVFDIAADAVNTKAATRTVSNKDDEVRLTLESPFNEVRIVYNPVLQVWVVLTGNEVIHLHCQQLRGEVTILEALVLVHGEQHRRLIEDALKFLDEHEPIWGVTLDRRAYVRSIVERVPRNTQGAEVQ